ncbi:MAG: excinuclease ABC subunit UvrA [Bacteroidales bacterium]|nr:excinuclease ABC subunit UvrA [Bacteroidales bacterium]
MAKQQEQIEVLGARVHNLKNIDVSIPRNSLTVITGLSGSGKSSLAFDTIYAEGQRRYIETFSAYARGFLGVMERPDVDKITGLSPVISIEQKTTNRNPRSTVGTVTEIYDFLRLLFARIGTAYDYTTGEPMVKYTEEKIIEMVLKQYEGHRIYILASYIHNRKGHYKELFEQIRKKGMLHARVDGKIIEITPGMKLDRYKNHNIEVVIDKLAVKTDDANRLRKSIALALKEGEGLILIWDETEQTLKHYSKRLMGPTSGIAYKDPAPHNFSFNSSMGACNKCKGLGRVSVADEDKIAPDKTQSIYTGALLPLGGYKNSLIFWQIEAILKAYDCDLKTPLEAIPAEALSTILNGSNERIRIPAKRLGGKDDSYVTYEGIIHYVLQVAKDATGTSTAAEKWVEQFAVTVKCPQCKGARLNREALHFRINDKNIHELSSMDISELYIWLQAVEPTLGETHRLVAHEILKELLVRLKFLIDVGLDYLSLSRSSVSLSGGESQRIRLATQIGSQLVNVLYILDEPSIGLHQRDNVLLIDSLKALRDAGNTVVVVEHDKDMMLAADHIIDMGPKAGRHGGEVVFAGTPKQMLKQKTLTSQYITGDIQIETPTQRRTSNTLLRLRGAKGNNLRNVTVEFPLGTLICVTGVSGSGKSTLINDTLMPILSQHFYRSLQEPLPYEGIDGLEYLDKVVSVDQSPLGRTPRSNPATYTGVFSDIRSLFVNLPEAKIRGYKPGRFSFNVKGGRCEVCKGNGYKTIEMNFLPDVYVPCEICHGKRYNRETLEVRYKGKNIGDILDMTINQAVDFFEHQPTILNKIKVIQDVGLGYIKLGQSSTTLSGGESQRIKLASELSKRDTGKTIYILDEPTTGLHFEDIRVLMKVLNRLVERGNTIIVIEHNLDVIKAADYLIDMGPNGGRDGGQVLAVGTPEAIAMSERGYTAGFIKQELGI